MWQLPLTSEDDSVETDSGWASEDSTGSQKEGKDRVWARRSMEEIAKGTWIDSIIIRFWTAYVFLLCQFIVVAGNVAVIPQFLSVEIWSANALASSFLLCVCYPTAAVLIALVAQVQWTLTLNSVVHKPMIEFRTSLLAILGNRRKALYFVDAGITIALLGLPLLAMIASWNLHHHTGTIMTVGFLIGSCWFSSFLTIMVIIVDLLKRGVSRYWDRFEMLMAEAEAAGVQIRSLDFEDRKETDVHSAVRLLLISNFVELVSAIVFYFIDVPPWFAMLILFGAFYVESLAISRIFPSIVRSHTSYTRMTCYWRVVLLYFIFTVIVGVGPPLLGMLGKGANKTMSNFGPSMISGGQGFEFQSTYNVDDDPGYDQYPVCLMRFGKGYLDPRLRLGILDIAAFTNSVNFVDAENAMQEVRNATQHTAIANVSLERLSDPYSLGRAGVFAIHDARVRLLSIRGSTTPADWLLNLDIWAPSFLYVLSTSLIPFEHMLPREFAGLVLSSDLRRLVGAPVPWQHLHDEVRAAKLKSEADGYELILTGHSLGGGLAQMIGGLEGLLTVAFSPVGVSLTAARVGLDYSKTIESNVITIVPRGDLVPQAFDRQDGLVQYITCTSLNPWGCHNLVRAACELYRKCGDPRGRSLAAKCQTIVGKDWNATDESLGFLWT